MVLGRAPQLLAEGVVAHPFQVVPVSDNAALDGIAELHTAVPGDGLVSHARSLALLQWTSHHRGEDRARHVVRVAGTGAALPHLDDQRVDPGTILLSTFHVHLHFLDCFPLLLFEETKHTFRSSPL